MSQTQANHQDMPQLLTTRQAAAYIGVSRDTVRRLALQREFPVIRIFGGRNWRVHRKDIDIYIQRAKMTL